MPWTPQPGPQSDFLSSEADEIFYGGAAGGGKSDALLAEAVRDVALPGYHALLLRRTYPELEGKGSGLIPRSEELWQSELGGQFDREKLLWTFPSGATVGFGNLERASSVYAYHSAQFACLCFDELTTFLESQFLYMLSRLRSPVGIRTRIRAAGNPGGIGHSWVRRRYIERLKPFDIKWFKRSGIGAVLPLRADALLPLPQGEGRGSEAAPASLDAGVKGDLPNLPHSSAIDRGPVDGADDLSPTDRLAEIETTADDPDGMSRQFIPAKVFDNRVLLDNDPGYLRRLKALDPIDRRRLLEGDWFVANAGSVYGSFNSANLTDEEPIPNAPMELAFDDGYADPRVFLFIQRRGDHILIADEFYHVKHLYETCVSELVAHCQSRGWPLPEIAVGSPEAGQLREHLRRADIVVRTMATPIVDGIGAVRSLVVDDRGHRTLRVHRRCTNLLRELQGGYQYSTAESTHSGEKPLDHDNHCVDALRYWVWLRARRR